MSIFDRYPQLVRPLSALLVLLLGAAACVTFVNYAGSPTDENLFADLPRPMSLYVTSAIPCLASGTGLTPEEKERPGRDTIRVGDLIETIGGVTVSDSSSLDSALASSPGDSELRVRFYRPRHLSFDERMVRRSDFPASFALFIRNFIAVTDVTPGGASDRAGLKVGDLLFRINDLGFATAKEADLILRRGQSGKTIVYEALRNNEMLRLNVTLARFGMPLPILLFSLSGMCMMALGGFIGLKRPRIPAARIVGLALLLLGYFFATTAIRREIDVDLFVRVRDLMVTLSIIAGAAIAMRSMAFFPRENPELISRRWIPLVYGAIGTAMFACSLLKLGQAINVGIVLLIIFHIVVSLKYRKGASAEHRKMSAPIYRIWSVMGLFLLFLIAYQSIRGEGDIGLILLTVLGIMVFGVTCAYLYVIGRYRLLDLDFRIRRNVQYSLISVAWGILMAAVLVNLFLWLPSLNFRLPAILIHGWTIEAVDEPASGPVREWTSRLALITIGTASWYLLWRLRKAGQTWIDRKYYRAQYDYRQAVGNLTEVLATKLTLADLGEALTEKIAELGRVKRAGVFFFREGAVSASRVAHGVEGEIWDRFRARVQDGLIRVLEGSGEHIHADYLPPAQKEAFRAADFQLIVPVRSRSRLLGAIVLGEKLSEATYRREDYEFLAAAAAQSALAMENAFLYEELAEKERMRHELAIARRIQLASLPQKTPNVKGLDIAGVSVPAMEVGGDFFDYLNGSSDRLTVVVGDVSGKGTSAALYMSKVQGILRSLHGFGLSPAELFVRANRLLCGDMEKSSFVTAVGAAFDLGSHTFVLARAGHLPLYLFRAAEARVLPIIPRGLGLGLNNAGVFSTEIEEKSVPYERDDVLLFVTDGVTEAQSREGEQYGEERLMKVLSGRAAGSAAAICDTVIRELTSFSEGAIQHDDETVVVIKIV
jgi:serine phosphatase RsbU (regulator of sigma subunit)